MTHWGQFEFLDGIGSYGAFFSRPWIEALKNVSKNECENPNRGWLSYRSPGGIKGSWKYHSFYGWFDSETPIVDFSETILIEMFSGTGDSWR
jgi:hypothetical protein